MLASIISFVLLFSTSQEYRMRRTIEPSSQAIAEMEANRGRRPRIFYRQTNIEARHIESLQRAEFDFREDEDDIGMRLPCFACRGIFYECQYNDHLKMCREQLERLKKGEEMMKKGKQEEVGQKETINSKEVLKREGKRQEQDVEKDQCQGQAKLERFEEQQLQVSKISKRNCALKEKKVQIKPQNDELTLIPCPFCAQELSLDQLNHVEKCTQSVQCKHCQDRYPKDIYPHHLRVCARWNKPNTQANYDIARNKPAINFKSGKNSKNEATIIQSMPMRFGNGQNTARALPRRDITNPPQCPQQNHPSPESYVPVVSQPLNARLLDEQSRIRKTNHKGLSRAQIRSLQVLLFVPKEEGEECCICALELQTGEEVTSLKCKHLFHKDCLMPWVEERGTCPSCKARIGSDL